MGKAKRKDDKAYLNLGGVFGVLSLLAETERRLRREKEGEATGRLILERVIDI